MPCTNDPYGFFMPLQPGDRLTVWLEKKSANYYRSGQRTITDTSTGKSHQANVSESLLDPTAPLTYIFQTGEVFDVVLRFSGELTAGKKAEVHVQIASGDGQTIRYSWCANMKSGPTTDIATFLAK